MAGRSRAGSNALYLLMQGMMGSLFGLFQLKIFTNYMATESFGVYLAMRGLAMLLTSLAVLGLPSLALRYLPQYETHGDRRGILRFCGLLLLGMILTCSVTGLLAWHFRLPLAGNFEEFSGAASLMSHVLLLAAAMALTEFCFNLFQGMRRMGPMSIVDTVALACLTAHLLILRHSLTTERALDLFSIYFILRGLVLLSLFPKMLPSREGASGARGALRIAKTDMLNYWLLSLPLRWVALSYMELDRYVVGLVALELVHLFHVPSRITGVSKRFLAAPMLSLQTEISRLYQERRELELSRHLQLFIRAQLALSIWMGATILLLVKPLIIIFSNREYLTAIPLLAIMLLTLPLGSLIASLEAVFRGLNGLRVVLVGNILWTIVYFGSLVWFAEQFGLVGLGLAQLCGMTLQVLWVLGCARKRGWVSGLGRTLIRTSPWILMPLLPALTAAFTMPGCNFLQPSLGGLTVGMVLLLLGVVIILRGERFLRTDEKLWFLSRLPVARLRGFVGRIIGVSEVN
ncbi:MAG: lipopolysaccharide biosynthesis protein [bacterium]|nr:lipopolysaccharide biosynthesis protein [bacterium]